MLDNLNRFIIYPHHNPSTIILDDVDFYNFILNNPQPKIGTGLGLVIWSPLGSGILTGKYNGNDKEKVVVPAGSRLSQEDNICLPRKNVI